MEKLFNEYLHTQIEALSKYKHSLSKIIFVIAQDNISESYSTENDGITYLYRKNGWLSFGSWMEAIRIYSNYDYYILCEDDYIFMKDNYDTVLVSELEKQGVEYLVTWKNDSSNKGKFRGG